MRTGSNQHLREIEVTVSTLTQIQFSAPEKSAEIQWLAHPDNPAKIKKVRLIIYLKAEGLLNELLGC